MEKKINYFTFQFQNEKNEKINCELIFSFYVKDIDKNFLLFTDYTKNHEGYLNVYPYYEDKIDSSLLPVTDKGELSLVNSVYETIKKSVKE